MTIPSYDVGDMVRLGNHAGSNEDDTSRQPFADVDGTPTDPTNVDLSVRTPSGLALVYNWPTQGAGTGLLVKEAIGRFYYDLELAEHGLWHWALAGHGVVDTTERGAFYVRQGTV